MVRLKYRLKSIKAGTEDGDPYLESDTSEPLIGAQSELTSAVKMVSRTAIPFLVAMMLFTGVCNTLLTKYQVWASSDLASIVSALLSNIRFPYLAG